MRKIILSLAVSLDGFIEGPNGEVDWMSFDDETGIELNRFLNEIDTILYGRVSYETWGSYTPSENSLELEKNFYARVNKMSKYVFSSSNRKFEGNAIHVQSEIEQTIQDLKRQAGKNIWLYGGAGLITTFINLNLIDEIRMAVIPIILGAGKPMFKDLHERTKLRLINARAAKSGVVALSYDCSK
jgi:dihydrofolate reductase